MYKCKQQTESRVQHLIGSFLHGTSMVESVRHVTINKARKSSFGEPRQVILQSDWSNKNESYTPGTQVQGSVCGVEMT